jgi:hypothetical protein
LDLTVNADINKLLLHNIISHKNCNYMLKKNKENGQNILEVYEYKINSLSDYSFLDQKSLWDRKPEV